MVTRWRAVAPTLALALVLVPAVLFLVDTPTEDLPVSGGHEVIAIFKLAGGLSLKHLDPVPDHALLPAGGMSINQSHTLGWHHRSIRIHLFDSEGKMLLLRRSANLRTCPGTWGPVGEHVHEEETPTEAAKRALAEELGTEASSHIRVSCNITQSARFVHAVGDGRIENQAVWMWVVVLSKPASAIAFRFDEEVADHRWVTLQEFGEGLEAGQFCGDTQRRLGLLAMERLGRCDPLWTGSGGARVRLMSDSAAAPWHSCSQPPHAPSLQPPLNPTPSLLPPINPPS